MHPQFGGSLVGWTGRWIAVMDGLGPGGAEGQMYAISHAATALVLKRWYPRAPMWPLLISVQLLELFWVIFSYVGIEHIAVSDDHIHLDFLPFSHSVATAVGLALVVWSVAAFALKRPQLGFALALGVVSHIILDIIQHEPDIRLLPIDWGPRLGLDLQAVPLLNLIVELAYGAACWRIFRGRVGLLVAIVTLNLLNIPLLFPSPGAGATLAAHPAVLPTIILVQIVVTWIAIWWMSRQPRETRSATTAGYVARRSG
jgi:hypothetical protein